MLPVVIVAAGTASRLMPYSMGMHKSLMELEPNVTILDFILDKLEKINPTRIIAVIRPQLKNSFEERLKGKADLIETDLEDFGNLYSVSLAISRLGEGPLLLLMSDHIFEQSMLDMLLASKGRAAFTVCLDRKPSQDEAKEGLKLTLRKGVVAYAGKAASPRYGIDTGMMLCRSNSRAYVEKALEKFGHGATIADALSLAAADGEVDYVDVTGKLWKDIDTPGDLAKAREVYWKILGKDLSKPEDGLVSRYLNRPLSTRISIFLYRRGLMVEPMIITLASFVLALVTSFLLTLKEFILGGLLVQTASVVDGMDGELARLYRKASPLGAYIDSVLDRLSDVAIVAGLALSTSGMDGPMLSFAILAAANVILVSYITHNLKSLGVDARKLRSVPATRDVRLFVVFVMSVLSLPIYALYYLALAPLFYLGYSIALASTAQKRLRVEKVETRTEKVSRKAEPVIRFEKRAILSKIESLISNSIKLALGLLFVHMISPTVSEVPLIQLGDLALSSDHLLSAFSLAMIIYFGYRIVLALRAIADVATERLVDALGITETTLKHILGDAFYIALAALLWAYLPSKLKLVPYFGEYLSRLVALATFIFFLLILYDLARLLYRTFEKPYRKILEKMAETLHRSSE